MPSAWDVVQEKKLLLAIIDLTNPKPPQWPLVADRMGGAFSSEACRQHYQKIRRTSAAAATPSSSPVKPSTPKATPTKNKKRKLSSVAVSTAEDDSEPDTEFGCKVKDEQDPIKGILFKIEEGEGGSKKPINLERTDE